MNDVDDVDQVGAPPPPPPTCRIPGPCSSDCCRSNVTNRPPSRPAHKSRGRGGQGSQSAGCRKITYRYHNDSPIQGILFAPPPPTPLPPPTPPHTHTHSHKHPPPHTCTHPLTQTCTHTRTPTHAPTPTLTPAHTPAHSHPHMRTCALTKVEVGAGAAVHQCCQVAEVAQLCAHRSVCVWGGGHTRAIIRSRQTSARSADMWL